MPRVSAYIPAFNHEGFVEKAIESVLGQTFPDLELIICDDASTDGTLSVIESVTDTRIRSLKNECNMGASFTAMRCLESASGEFIAPLSSDDIWHPEKLARQIPLLEENANLAAVFTPPRFIGDTGEELDPVPEDFAELFPSKNRTSPEWLRQFFEEGNCLCLPSALIRATAYRESGGFDPRLEQLPDLDLWIRLARTNDFHILEERLVDFRLHSDHANASFPRPEISSRVTAEMSHILHHYLEGAGLASLGIEQSTPAIARLRLAERAWEIGTDYHRLFAIQTILGADLAGLSQDELTDFTFASRKILSEVEKVWVGGRIKFHEASGKLRNEKPRMEETSSPWLSKLRGQFKRTGKTGQGT